MEINTQQNQKRKEIIQSAQNAKLLLETLLSGNHIMDFETHKESHVDKKILELFHFRQYTQMYKYAFEEWDTQTTSEKTYLDIGQEAKTMNDLLKHEIFQETLCSLLWLKAQNTRRTIDDIYAEYMNIVGRSWKEAGLIRNLRMNNSTLCC